MGGGLSGLLGLVALSLMLHNDLPLVGGQAPVSPLASCISGLSSYRAVCTTAGTIAAGLPSPYRAVTIEHCSADDVLSIPCG